MLDLFSSSSAHGSPSDGRKNGTQKRIPASLMEMRRESLATSGKYKLPTIEVGEIDNSLFGMTQQGRNTLGNNTHSSTVDALVTPRRQGPKSIKLALDQATSFLQRHSSPLLADLENEIDDSPRQQSSGGSLRGSRTTTDGATDMQSLMRTGLATPRRTEQRSLAVKPDALLMPSVSSNHSKRVSKMRSKSGDGSSPHSNGSERRRRPVRRSKSVDGDHVALATPRRGSRKPTVRKPGSSRSRRPEEEPVVDVVDSSNNTSASSWDSFANGSTTGNSSNIQKKCQPKEWLCTCGETNEGEQNFCGMCGSSQRWECSDCDFKNKCKFRFCGMCGIAKKAKGELQ
ncbi:expressed unknown protein [Seminavis robusta]|uniref:RanBP2-type domain-containing protein n=1 Tax=Seminavis robusta TaxID=568900 RepID=A0A9N8DM86_9STRA|nr:expressed unknown protein [Seminavis robusta]|eukprot:Sro238_g095670.1 n/a (343) ;mRNA; f:78030-79058